MALVDWKASPRVEECGILLQNVASPEPSLQIRSAETNTNVATSSSTAKPFWGERFGGGRWLLGGLLTAVVFVAFKLGTGSNIIPTGVVGIHSALWSVEQRKGREISVERAAESEGDAQSLRAKGAPAAGEDSSSASRAAPASSKSAVKNHLRFLMRSDSYPKPLQHNRQEHHEPAAPTKLALVSEAVEENWMLRELASEVVFSWENYEKFALGHDEVGPLSGKPNDWDYSLAFLVDGLDTLLLFAAAGVEPDGSRSSSVMHDMAARALQYLCESSELAAPTSGATAAPSSVSFFETVIRRLGGFLGAYHVLAEADKKRRSDGEGASQMATSTTKNKSCLRDLAADTALRLRNAFAVISPPHGDGENGDRSLAFPRGEVQLGTPEDSGIRRPVGADGRFVLAFSGLNPRPPPPQTGRVTIGLAEAGSNVLEFADAAATVDESSGLKTKANSNSKMMISISSSSTAVAAELREAADTAENTMEWIIAQVGTKLRDKERPSLPGRMVTPVDDSSFGSLVFEGEPTVSAGSDSFYEYLLKRWLQQGPGARDGEHEQYLTLWLDSMRMMVTQLVRGAEDDEQPLRTAADFSPSKRIFLASSPGVRTMQHLGCYVPGMLVLGVHSAGNKVSVADFDLFLAVAKGLLRTCVGFHTDVAAVEETTAQAQTPTLHAALPRFPASVALAPEIVQVLGGRRVAKNLEIVDGLNQLRPEILESMFYFFYFDVDLSKEGFPGFEQFLAEDEDEDRHTTRQLSPSQRYLRRFAYEIFSAFRKEAKAEFGYASTQVQGEETSDHSRRGARSRHPVFVHRQKDKEESFWLGETVKYLFLLLQTDPKAGIDLDKFVLNTEAHPLRRNVETL
eukprot:CAMPEP_0178994070 /NCGR_PEP_ID=MMETSP0795-20121207/7071_1 /TAXON_ID=88552 /ORGANISM="Amoebophrya sp., Strain Ameob2" /LENGTH=854 /DNA_ID=CAMNT_0020686233 /DNA_START=48 /DNA_END=2612 /DNA_ORIENTATION=-